MSALNLTKGSKVKKEKKTKAAKEKTVKVKKEKTPKTPKAPKARAKNDIYTLILLLAWLALVTACVLLYMDIKSYSM